MLTLRARGPQGTYYIRGTVALGDKSIRVEEFSSGTSSLDAAAHLMREHETALTHRLMFGPSASLAGATMSEAFVSYLTKSPPPHSSDVLRIGKLNELIGDFSITEPKQAWEAFRVAYLLGHAPAGQDRYRTVLQAAINVHHDRHDMQAIKIKPIPFSNERVRWLTHAERDHLIPCYPKHVQPIITLMAFHGPRTQTALQVQWGSDGVDMHRKAIRLYHQKTGAVGSVPMHPRVEAVLLPLWESRGQPSKGHVFLNRVGKPYQDTSKSPIPGGNPLKNSHATALERSGIEDFTIHDWRHHWASHCVMAGIDLITIMHMGGWKSLRMVQRYASVGVEHMRESINKLV